MFVKKKKTAGPCHSIPTMSLKPYAPINYARHLKKFSKVLTTGQVFVKALAFRHTNPINRRHTPSSSRAAVLLPLQRLLNAACQYTQSQRILELRWVPRPFGPNPTPLSNFSSSAAARRDVTRGVTGQPPLLLLGHGVGGHRLRPRLAVHAPRAPERRPRPGSGSDSGRRRRWVIRGAPAAEPRGAGHPGVHVHPAGQAQWQGRGGLDRCAVCLGAIQVGAMVKLLPSCGHVYHRNCIDLWLSSRPTCPLCPCRVGDAGHFARAGSATPPPHPARSQAGTSLKLNLPRHSWSFAPATAADVCTLC